LERQPWLHVQMGKQIITVYECVANMQLFVFKKQVLIKIYLNTSIKGVTC